MSVLRGILLNKFAVIGMLMALSAPALASLTPMWSGAVTDSGSVTDFDTGTLLFPAQSAGQISIVNSGIGYTHDHGVLASATVEVLRNGVWTLVFTGPVSNNIDIPLSSFPVPLPNFASGQITGVRLSTTKPVGFAFHSIQPNMQFLLAGGAPTIVPTLSTYGVFALILSLMSAGWLVMRRRQPPR